MTSIVKTGLEVTRLTGALGAEVRGIDLSQLDDESFAKVRELLLEHLVLFFPGQHISPEAQVAFGRRFGELHIHPFAPYVLDGYPEVIVIEGDKPNADSWHSDVTYEEEPPLATIFKVVTLPSVGGDTMWSNQYLAYEKLSQPMRGFLDKLTAFHSSKPAFPGEELTATQPVVRVHPETGKRALYVNRTFTKHIVELSRPRPERAGMSRSESDAVLEFLFEWSEKPEFQLRYRWSVGDIGIWDNRCTMHYAVADYHEWRRAERVTVMGDTPQGPR
jgi:taurine dioxygenase